MAKTKWKKNIGAKEIEKEGKCIYTTGESEGWGDWEGLSCNQRQHLLYKENYILHQCFSLHISFIKFRFSVKLEDEMKIEMKIDF